MANLFSSFRAQYRSSPSAESFAAADESAPFEKLYPVLSLLSYMLKAPLVKEGTGVVNSLARQRQALEQFLKACLGLESSGDLLLSTRLQ
jgi:myo-inositol-1-phosphate synthase